MTIVQSARVASPVVAARHAVRSLSLRSYAWRKEPRATRSWRNRNARVRNTSRAGLGTTCGSARMQSAKLQARDGKRNRRLRERKKSSAALVERRRLGPGKPSALHGTGGEAVLANLTESDTRAPRYNARPGIERDSRQRCQRLGRMASWKTCGKPTGIRLNTPPRNAVWSAEAIGAS